MLTKENFVKIIEKIQAWEAFLTKLEKNIHIDILAIPELFLPSEVQDKFFIAVFGEKGADVINWWLYEDGREIYNDANEVEYILTTPDKLYEYVIQLKNNS